MERDISPVNQEEVSSVFWRAAEKTHAKLQIHKTMITFFLAKVFPTVLLFNNNNNNYNNNNDNNNNNNKDGDDDNNSCSKTVIQLVMKIIVLMI